MIPPAPPAPLVALGLPTPPGLPASFQVVTEDITRRMLHRVYWEKQPPLEASFARDNRYDCPPAPIVPASQQFGVLYLAFDFETCWMETVVRSNMVRPAGTNIQIPTNKMADRWACNVFARNYPLSLAKFADEPLIDLGESTSNIMGDSYLRTKEWSRLLHAHTNPAIDGIYYRSRFKGDHFCIALFDRAIKSKQLYAQNFRSINPATSAEIQAIMNRYQVVAI